MRCAVVDIANNVIVNTIVADPAVDSAPDGMMLAMVPEFVNPGDLWNGGVFTPPSPAMPAAKPPPKAIDGLEML